MYNIFLFKCILYNFVKACETCYITKARSQRFFIVSSLVAKRERDRERESKIPIQFFFFVLQLHLRGVEVSAHSVDEFQFCKLLLIYEYQSKSGLCGVYAQSIHLTSCIVLLPLYYCFQVYFPTLCFLSFLFFGFFSIN